MSTFFKQIDSYLKSLDVISEEDNERGVKAHCLLHLYREVSLSAFSPVEINSRVTGIARFPASTRAQITCSGV